MAFITKEQRNNPNFAPVIKDLEHAEYLVSRKGWTAVNYPHGYESRYHAIDIELWVEENLGVYWRMGRTYFFEDSQDALMFLLKYT